MKKLLIILFSGICGVAFGALTVVNVTPTNITTTSAWFNATISATNGAGGVTGAVYYGTVDAGTNLSWLYTNTYGNIADAVPVNISTQITGLSAWHKYYYRWRLSEGGSNNWATGTSNFWTKPSAPTSTPAVVTVSLQTDTNGLLKAPTNFFNANTQFIATAIGGTYATIAALNGLGTYATNVFNFAAGVSGLVDTVQANTNNLNTRVSGIEANTGEWETAYTDSSSATGSIASLESDITALETSTGTLNTAVSALNNATNALNTRADSLESATGALNIAVGNLQTSTGSLNTAVGNLNDATNFLNTRAGNLELATNALQIQATAALTGMVAKVGAIMTGPLTNTAGYYGNGAGMTNIGETTNSLALGGVLAANWARTDIAETFDNSLSIGYGWDAGVGNVAIGNYWGTHPDITGTGNVFIGMGEWEAGVSGGNVVGCANLFIASATNPANTILVHHTNNACIVQGNDQTTLEDNSLVNDAVRSKAFYLYGTNLNTWFGYLFAATGSLDTAVTALNDSTNALQIQETALQGATGALNTAVGDLETSTGTLNTAVARIDANAITNPVGADVNWNGFSATNINILRTTNYVWVPVNGTVYFGTTTNRITDQGGTNFLFQCGTQSCNFGWGSP